MWDNDTIYENEYGKCAYITGAIRTLTQGLDVELYNIGVKYEALDCDVFCIGPCNDDNIKSYVSERIEKYMLEESVDKQETEKMLDEVQKFKICQNDYSMSDVIASLYMNHKEVDKEQIRKVIDIYCVHVNYYLGKPQRVYTVIRDSFDMTGVISSIYLGILFDIVFVQFESHLLMFLRGSSE